MMYPNLLRSLLILSICMTLMACSIVRQSTPYDIVAPAPEFTINQVLPTVKGTLQIQRPLTDRTRDSDRILVRESGTRLRVYPATVWVDAAPEMLQTVMIRAFEDAERFDGAYRSGIGRTDFQLRTEIRRFEAVDDGGADLGVELEIRAGLFHVPSSRKLGTRTFHRQTAAEGSSRDALVLAFEHAMGLLVSDLVDWVVIEADGAAPEQ